MHNFEVAVQTAIHWRFRPQEQERYALTVEQDFGDCSTPIAVFSCDEVAAFNPQLAELCPDLFDNGKRELYGELMRTTVALLTEEPFCLPASACEGEHKVFYDILFMPLLLTDTKPYPVLSYKHLEYATTASGLRYLYNLRYCNQEVNAIWLDEVFPGWSNRLATAHALGVSETELIEQVFQRDTRPAETLDLPIGLT